MLPLYPDIKPYRTHSLEVDPPHVLHVEECGEPDGIPVLFLHGGPGAGCNHRSRCFFDPEVCRIILFDQRGSGLSRPHASVENNTTADLLADIEHIRTLLGVDRWLLFGGSWGATLALAYAQAHPQNVSGMILRGVFLCRQRDIDWFYRDGASRVFPEAWEEFTTAIAHDGDLVAAYHEVLNTDNELERMAAARSWATWEATCATLRPHTDFVESIRESHNALALARLETHYFINGGFLEPDQLLENAPALTGIPGYIVHGRYDMVCALDNAYALHNAWPDSELLIVREGGHSPFEPAMIDALVHATADMLEILKSEQ